ncbi:hypothetical protein D3C87_75750 [compost metagenome]
MEKIEVEFVFYESEDSSAVITAAGEVLKLGANGFKHFIELEQPQTEALLFTKRQLTEQEADTINKIETEEDGIITDLNAGGEYEIEELNIILVGSEKGE